MQLDSTDVTAADRQRMAQAVWQNREKFDGFVLTHGTDTLAYTAALLTHLLPHFDKPLVLTGSMLPMGVPDSGCAAQSAGCVPHCGRRTRRRVRRDERSNSARQPCFQAAFD